MSDEKLVIRANKVNNLVSKLIGVIGETTPVGKLFKKAIVPLKAEEEEGELTIAEIYLALAETISQTSRMFGKMN